MITVTGQGVTEGERQLWHTPLESGLGYSLQKSTLLFHTHPSYQVTPSSLFPVWPYVQIPFSIGQEFHEYIQWTMITPPLLSPSSSSEIPQHASPQLNVVLRTSNIHAQLQSISFIPPTMCVHRGGWVFIYVFRCECTCVFMSVRPEDNFLLGWDFLGKLVGWSVTLMDLPVSTSPPLR